MHPVPDQIKWIRQQLDEEEAAAQAAAAVAAPPWQWKQQVGVHKYGLVGRHPVQPSTDEWVVPSAWPDVYPHRDTAEYIARHDPARALIEVQAKRDLIDQVLRAAEVIDRESCSHTADQIERGECDDVAFVIHDILEKLAVIA